MSAHLLARNFRPNYGLNYSSLDELWHVDSISGWTYDNTVSVVFAQVPRSLGNAIPELGSAVVVNISLHQYINPTDAIVLVQARTNHGTVYRFRSSAIQGYTGTMRVPYWARTTSASGVIWSPKEAIEPREYSRRVVTVYIRNGDLTDSFIQTINQQVGTVVRFPDNVNGIPYLMKSPSIVDYAPGQTRVIYSFETSCRVLAMPAGTILGQDVALPALDYLQEWYAPFGQTSGNPLPIQVRRWQDRYPLTLQSSVPFLNT